MILYKFLSNKLSQAKRLKLSALLNKLPEFNQITLIDIGAAGGIEPRWNQISKKINFIGFEPDTSAHKKMTEEKTDCKDFTVHPFAIWNDSEGISINFSKKPEVSSHFQANIDFLKNFPESDRFERVNVKSVISKTLDSLKIESPDFIKIDIQGAELNVLLGAEETLKNCMGIELEVEFAEIYLMQPLFGEISRHLLKSGFEFYDFINLCRWERDSFSGLGQLVFGDALFLRSPENFLASGRSDQEISIYLGILVLYNRFDIIKCAQKIISSDQDIKYQDFFREARKFRRRLNRVNNFVRLINKILRSISPATKLHLIN